MTSIERLPGPAIPAGVLRRIAEAFLPLDGGTLRDIGARREYQDYASSAAVTTGPDLRLHRIADTANSSSAGYGNWVGAPSPTGRRPTARSFT